MATDFDNLETYLLLVKTCSRYQVDPSSSIESETFFRTLLSQYNGPIDEDHLVAWLEKQLAGNFLAVKDRPRWIQGADWPFADGKPMFFVGQIDIQVSTGSQASQFFHDDTSFYVFKQKKGPSKVIVQQF